MHGQPHIRYILLYILRKVQFRNLFMLFTKDYSLPCPPYSPDLAPSNFHHFGPLRDAQRGTRFEDDDRVILAVRTWPREQETCWFREGTHVLLWRWRKAVDVDGEYVES